MAGKNETETVAVENRVTAKWAGFAARGSGIAAGVGPLGHDDSALEIMRGCVSASHVIAREKPNWPLITGVWTVAGLLMVGQLYLELIWPVTWGTLLGGNHTYIIFTQLSRAVLWIPLTPVVFALRRRIPLRGWWWPTGLGLHLAFAVLFMMWILVVRAWVFNVVWMQPMVGNFSLDAIMDRFAVRTLTDFFIYWILLGVGYTLDIQRANQAMAVHESQLNQFLAEAQLSALRQQMHPHFLHNALNVIAELVRGGRNAEAVGAIVKLSSLQRTLLSNVADREVPLADELEFIEKFLDLERLRFGNRLTVRIEADAAVRRALVPSLLLQPLVENATKHGIGRRIAPGTVGITATRQGDRLRLEITNDVPENGEAEEEGDGEVSPGIGLANLRGQLERLYPGEHRFEFTLPAGRPAQVVVELPCRFGPAGVSSPNQHAKPET